MKRWMSKLISLLLIFTISVASNLLPLRVSDYFHKQGERGVKVLSCLMCFGGGVFFATYMLHLSPEVMQIMNEAVNKPYNIHYPLAELLMMVGFFLILFMEYAVNKCSKDPHIHSHHHPTSPANSHPLTEQREYSTRTEETLVGLTTTGANGCSHLVVEFDGQDATDTAEDAAFTPDKSHSTESVRVDIIEPDPSQLRSTRSLLLLLALSLHHVFEGMGIGLQDSQANVWSLTIAIISHEIVIAFSLGLQLVKNYSWKQVVLAAVFCNGMTPIGTAIGILLVETPGNQTSSINIANGVLQALSTGVFIYVTFLEILQNELGHGGAELSKLLSLLAGFGVLALLVLFPEDSINTAETAPFLKQFDNSSLLNN